MKFLSNNFKNQLRKNLPLYILITAIISLLFIFNSFIYKVISLEVESDKYKHFIASLFFFIAVFIAFSFVAFVYYKNLKCQYSAWKVFGARYGIFLQIMTLDFIILLSVGCLIGYTVDSILSYILILDGENHIYLTSQQVGISLLYELIMLVFYYCVIACKLYKVTKSYE